MSPAAIVDHAEGESAALTAAADLFYKHGIAAVTMSEIRDQSGVSLRRLYTLYPSKVDLVSAWLRHRHQTWTDSFRHRVEQRLQSGDVAIDAIFGALEEWMTETEFRGCAFINSHAEASKLIDDHREIIRLHKESFANYLESLTSQGRALAVIVDGAIVQAAIFAGPDPIHHARHAAEALTAAVTDLQESADSGSDRGLE